MDKLQFLVPFYSQVKILVYILMLLWRSAGAVVLYDKVLKPCIKPYEPALDFVGGMAGAVVDYAFTLVLYLPKWIKASWTRRTEKREVDTLDKVSWSCSILDGWSESDPSTDRW